MGERHKHADVIIAWANGEEIEFRHSVSNEWEPVSPPTRLWKEEYEYRVKPKIVKKEGWVNVYSALSGYPMAQVFDTEKEAMNAEDPLKLRKATVRIEWEEEV